MKKRLPIFKFHKDPLMSGSIISGNFKCPVCLKNQEYAYIGPFFSVEEVDNICPWCISDGSAAKKYKGQFQDSASIESHINESDLDELIHRTPGYTGWQQEQWLVHCGVPCQFISRVGWKELQNQNIDVDKDINRLCDEFNITEDQFKRSLIKNGSLQGYLFVCIICGTYRLTADFD